MDKKPKLQKLTDDPRVAEIRRYVRGIQKLAADIDPDFAIELGRELESERRKKKAVVKLGEKV